MFSFLTILLSLTNPVLPPEEPVVRVENVFIGETAVPQKSVLDRAPLLLENKNVAILAQDVASGKVLFSRNVDRPQHIASLTKLMTALIILEHHSLDEVVVVPIEATDVEGASLDLYAQESLTVETLLRSILIGSANDAAVALAYHHSGSEAAFAQVMNQKASDWGLDSASFLNATGLDIIEEVDDERNFEVYGNQMSARDILQLARQAIQNPFVRETVKQSLFEGTSVDGKFFHEKKTTNQLLGNFQNVKGLKTGFTYLAGQCFVAFSQTDDGQEVLTVILGSTDRFGETKKLLAWLYDTYVWR